MNTKSCFSQFIFIFVAKKPLEHFMFSPAGNFASDSQGQQDRIAVTFNQELECFRMFHVVSNVRALQMKV